MYTGSSNIGAPGLSFNSMNFCHEQMYTGSSNIGAPGLSFNSMNFCHEQMYNIMPIKIILMS
jgi:hypothetical protein